MIYLNNKLYGNFISKLLYNKFFHNQGTQIPYSQFEINRFLLPFYLLYPANFTFIDSLLIFPLVQLGNDVKTHTVLAGDFLIHIVATSRIKWGWSSNLVLLSRTQFHFLPPLFCPLLCLLHPTLGLAPDAAVPGFASAHQVPLAFKARILKLTFIDVIWITCLPSPKHSGQNDGMCWLTWIDEV